MLLYTDLERLRNKEGLSGDTKTFLGKGNRIDFAGGLEADEVWNRRNQVAVERKKILGEMTGIWPFQEGR